MVLQRDLNAIEGSRLVSCWPRCYIIIAGPEYSGRSESLGRAEQYQFGHRRQLARHVCAKLSRPWIADVEQGTAQLDTQTEHKIQGREIDASVEGSSSRMYP